jgi:hypothetical protein
MDQLIIFEIILVLLIAFLLLYKKSSDYTTTDDKVRINNYTNNNINDTSKNNKLSLDDIARITSAKITLNYLDQIKCLISNNDFPEIFGTDPDSFNDSTFDLAFEIIAFSIHLSDRIAFHVIGPDNRSIFLDILIIKVMSSLSSSILEDESSENQIIFEKKFINFVNERSKYYTMLDLNSSDSTISKGSIFKEAGKQFATKILNGNPKAYKIFEGIFASCMRSLEDLDENLFKLKI